MQTQPTQGCGIEFNKINMIFADGTTAIKSLDLSIKQGEFVVLVGPSGCGKSTALRILAGLEQATGGTITINGHNVTDHDPQERDIAMIFQSYALYPHKTVFDNLAYPLQVRRVSKAEIAEKVSGIANMLGLTPLLNRKPGALSGGERQRVAMGRAMVRSPKAFLMDEPLSNLDAALRVEMRGEIRRLHRRLGVTTVYVTHDQVEAMTMGDRVAVLRGGDLQQFDTPQKLYEESVNIFVASFIGSPFACRILITQPACCN
jgi:multiple sugar transport system ATP-binding protein